MPQTRPTAPATYEAHPEQVVQAPIRNVSELHVPQTRPTAPATYEAHPEQVVQAPVRNVSELHMPQTRPTAPATYETHPEQVIQPRCVSELPQQTRVSEQISRQTTAQPDVSRQTTQTGGLPAQTRQTAPAQYAAKRSTRSGSGGCDSVYLRVPQNTREDPPSTPEATLRSSRVLGERVVSKSPVPEKRRLISERVVSHSRSPSRVLSAGRSVLEERPVEIVVSSRRVSSRSSRREGGSSRQPSQEPETRSTKNNKLSVASAVAQTQTSPTSSARSARGSARGSSARGSVRVDSNRGSAVVSKTEGAVEQQTQTQQATTSMPEQGGQQQVAPTATRSLLQPPRPLLSVLTPRGHGATMPGGLLNPHGGLVDRAPSSAVPQDFRAPSAMPLSARETPPPQPSVRGGAPSMLLPPGAGAGGPMNTVLSRPAASTVMPSPLPSAVVRGTEYNSLLQFPFDFSVCVGQNTPPEKAEVAEVAAAPGRVNQNVICEQEFQKMIRVPQLDHSIAIWFKGKRHNVWMLVVTDSARSLRQV